MVRLTAGEYRVTPRRIGHLHLDPHPDAPAESDWHNWVRNSTKPVAVDLFCGAGGLSHGLEAAGYRVVLAADTDKWALESHRHNIAGRTLRLDLADSRARSEIAAMLEGVDVGLVAGGPPCQPFSRAGLAKIQSLVRQGARGSDDDRRELWRPFLDLVKAIRPRAVLMENVPDMARGDGFALIRTMIEELAEAGYQADARIVDAWRYGVPQHRQRLILVGLRDGAVFKWPSETTQVTVREAIGDLPPIQVSPDAVLGAATMKYDSLTTHRRARKVDCENEASIGADAAKTNGDGTWLMSDFALRARQGCTGDSALVVHDHLTRSVRADDFEAFKLMDGRTLYSELPQALKRYRDDIFDDKYNRLGWDELSRTITAHLAKDGYWYIHPEQHRTLTVREAARIQTFPDNFRFAGYRSHQFQQIGNAVPPALAYQIGLSILHSFQNKISPQVPLRPELLLTAQRRKFRESMLRWADENTNAKRIITVLTEGRGRDQRWVNLENDSVNELVMSAPAVRVAGRVSGPDCPTYGSTAKMELAKLIGISEKATVLNMSTHALGTAVCKRQTPLCHRCPVSGLCASSETVPLRQSE